MSDELLPTYPQSDRELAEMIARFRTPPGFSWEPLANDIETVLKGRREPGPEGAADVPPDVAEAMARKPFNYVGRSATHYIIRYPITVHWPISLINEWGPYPIDRPTITDGDEGMPSAMTISDFRRDSFTRKSEEQGPVAPTVGETSPGAAVSQWEVALRLACDMAGVDGYSSDVLTHARQFLGFLQGFTEEHELWDGDPASRPDPEITPAVIEAGDSASQPDPEITPAMIEAGDDELCGELGGAVVSHWSPPDLACAVYLAMERARLRGTSTDSESDRGARRSSRDAT